MFAALADFGAPLGDLVAEDFADRGSFFRFGRDPRGIDILPDLPGVDFEAAWNRRLRVMIDSETGQIANFISRGDLIASKMASGRLRDLADVEEIRASEESQNSD